MHTCICVSHVKYHAQTINRQYIRLSDEPSLTGCREQSIVMILRWAFASQDILKWKGRGTANETLGDSFQSRAIGPLLGVKGEGESESEAVQFLLFPELILTANQYKF